MTAIAPYRIISYILLPIAALFGFMGLLMLILALSNPAIMIPTLIIMVIVVYIILSFIFFMKAVENGKKCKPTLRKWITATGIIAGLFSFTTLFNCIALFYAPDQIKTTIDQSMAMQKNMPAISSDLMVKVFKGVLYFMVFFATTLIIHVYETLKLIRQYQESFIIHDPHDE